MKRKMKRLWCIALAFMLLMQSVLVNELNVNAEGTTKVVATISAGDANKAVAAVSAGDANGTAVTLSSGDVHEKTSGLLETVENTTAPIISIEECNGVVTIVSAGDANGTATTLSSGDAKEEAPELLEPVEEEKPDTDPVEADEIENVQVSLTTYSDSYKSGIYYQRLNALVLLDNQVDNLLAVAKSQVGYHQGANANDLSGSSTTLSGQYTEYAGYHGYNNEDWCAHFVSWCARQAGIPKSILPSGRGCGAFRKSVGTYYDISSGVTPQPGDLLLLEPRQNGQYYVAPRNANGIPNLSSHIAIIESYTNGKIYYYEGNNNRRVLYSNKQWLPYQGNASHIQGFVRPNYTTGAGTGTTPDVSVDVPVTVSLSATGAYDIGTSTATVKGYCSKSGTNAWISTCGLYIGTSQSNMTKINTESVTSGANNMNSGTGFNIWYDLENELNYKLNAGTTYYYKFYGICNGTEYCSDIKSFTTQSTTVVYYSGVTVGTSATAVNVTAYTGYDSTTVKGTVSFPAYADANCTKFAVRSDGSKRFCILHTDGSEMWFDDNAAFTRHYYHASGATSDIPQQIDITTEDATLVYNYSQTPGYSNETMRVDLVSGDKYCANVYITSNGPIDAPLNSGKIYISGKSAGTATYKVVNQESETSYTQFTVTVLDTTAPNMNNGVLTTDETGFTITGEIWNSGEAAIPDIGLVMWRENVAENDVRDLSVAWNQGNGSIALEADPYNDNYVETDPDYSYMRYLYSYRVDYATYGNLPGVYNVKILSKDSHGNVSAQDYTSIYSPADANTNVELVDIVSSETEIALKWNGIETISGYNIYRKAAGSEWELLGTTTELEYTDTTAQKGVQYYYSVSAYMNYDAKVYESELSNSALTQQAVSLAEPEKGLVVKLKNPDEEYVYTGSAIKPEIIVTNNGKELVAGVDYTVKYTNNVAASINATASKKPKITITGKGNLTGSASTTFVINQKDISDGDVEAGAVIVTKGSKATPVLFFNNQKLTTKDYKNLDANTKYSDIENGGTMTIEGKGNFTGKRVISVKVVAKEELNKFTVVTDTKKSKDIYYEPGARQDAPIIVYNTKDKQKTNPLTEGEDYIVVYGSDRTNAGTVKFTVIGINKYTGSVAKTFKIKPLALKNGIDVQGIDADGYTYQSGGVTLRDSMIVTYEDEVLVEGVDYKVTYSNNKSISTWKFDKKAEKYVLSKPAKYTVTFIGNYKGSTAQKGTFIINPAPLTDTTEGLQITLVDQVYSGKPAYYKSTPIVTIDDVTLKSSNYTVTYYTDENLTEKVSSKNKVKIKEGEDYTTVYVKITGKGNYKPEDPETDYVTAEYKVWRKTDKIKISGMKVELVNEEGDKITKMTYTGQTLEPTVRVYYMEKKQKQYLTEHEDYEVTYVNNLNKGTATVVITGTGDTYVGSKTAKFSIVAKGLKSVKDLLNDLFS